MFVGHSLLAFAIAGAIAHRWGLPRERALLVGGAAALFAVAPDLDIVFAVDGLISAEPVAGFWTASEGTHRGATHSALVALPAAMAAAWWVAPERRYRAILPLAGTVALAGLLGGALGAILMFTFALGIIAASTLARRAGLEAREAAFAAAVAVVSHPFGDLFTGGPPPLLWPLSVEVFDGRIAPFHDETLDFLLAFGVELAVIWLGILVLLRLLELDPLPTLRTHVRPHAIVGVAYVGSIFVLQPPTMDLPYAFVLTILPLGALGLRRPVRLRTREWLLTVGLTGLSAVSVAVFAYTVAHVATSA